MRTLLAVFCALLVLSFSVDAKKTKVRVPASQKTPAAKQHRAAAKKLAKARKAKHRQRVN